MYRYLDTIKIHYLYLVPFLIVQLSAAAQPRVLEEDLQLLSSQKDDLDIFNLLGLVQANPNHTYSLLKSTQSSQPKLEHKDFAVTWPSPTLASKDHQFFSLVGGIANFSKSQFKTKYCLTSTRKEMIKAFKSVCGFDSYTDAQVENQYQIAYGDESVYRCNVPAQHFVVNIRFVPNLRNLGGRIEGRWYVFGGIHRYQDYSHASKIIKKYIADVSRFINQTKLNTFDINYNLNILPEFIKYSIAERYNNQQIGYKLLEDTVPFKENEITHEGFIKIVPPFTTMIIGGINNGTSLAVQSCDNFRGKGYSLEKVLKK